VYSQKYGTRAGGAANPEKKEAMAEQGVDVDPSLSASEAEAIAGPQGDHLTPTQRRGMGVTTEAGAGGPAGRRRQKRPAAPDRAELPTLSAAVSQAVLAVLAVPSVALLRLLRLFRRR
jgi:membrane protein